MKKKNGHEQIFPNKEILFIVSALLHKAGDRAVKWSSDTEAGHYQIISGQ